MMPDHGAEPLPVTLPGCTLFGKCDDSELALLDDRMEARSYAPGERIIQAGTSADELFVLISGSVEVRLQIDSRRYQRLDVFSAGMSFGELAFLDGSARSADVVAMEAVECRVMTRPLFEELGCRYPALKARILNEIALQLCDRLRQANIEISALRS